MATHRITILNEKGLAQCLKSAQKSMIFQICEQREILHTYIFFEEGNYAQKSTLTSCRLLFSANHTTFVVKIRLKHLW